MWKHLWELTLKQQKTTLTTGDNFNNKKQLKQQETTLTTGDNFNNNFNNKRLLKQQKTTLTTRENLSFMKTRLSQCHVAAKGTSK